MLDAFCCTAAPRRSTCVSFRFRLARRLGRACARFHLKGGGRRPLDSLLAFQWRILMGFDEGRKHVIIAQYVCYAGVAPRRPPHRRGGSEAASMTVNNGMPTSTPLERDARLVSTDHRVE